MRVDCERVGVYVLHSSTSRNATSSHLVVVFSAVHSTSLLYAHAGGPEAE